MIRWSLVYDTVISGLCRWDVLEQLALICELEVVNIRLWNRCCDGPVLTWHFLTFLFFSFFTLSWPTCVLPCLCQRTFDAEDSLTNLKCSFWELGPLLECMQSRNYIRVLQRSSCKVANTLPKLLWIWKHRARDVLWIGKHHAKGVLWIGKHRAKDVLWIEKHLSQSSDEVGRAQNRFLGGYRHPSNLADQNVEQRVWGYRHPSILASQNVTNNISRENS